MEITWDFQTVQCRVSRNPESVTAHKQSGDISSVRNSVTIHYITVSYSCFMIFDVIMTRSQNNLYKSHSFARIMADHGDQVRRKVVVIRKYEPEDHDRVRSLFYTGMMESWLSAYIKTLTCQAPLPPVICQVAQVSLIYQCSPSFLAFLLLQLLIQSLVIFTFFYLHWIFVQSVFHNIATLN